MSLKSILHKLRTSFNLSNDNSPKPKLTPNEVELMSYKKREYLDNVKKELYHYRKKNSMLNNPNWTKEFGERDSSLLSQKNTFNQKSTLNVGGKKTKKILDQKSLFIR